MQSKSGATSAHCRYCFQVLEAYLNKEQIPAYPKELPDLVVPIFVTWELKDNLRGCIGTFRPAKLSQILSRYALIAATQDDRFDPINKSELPNLTVAVSLLINFEKNKKAYDWELGKHGIIIEFTKNNRKYDATFLPEVATEWGWDQKQTLKELVEKSGYTRPLETVQNNISLTTYESSKAKLSYKQYAG